MHTHSLPLLSMLLAASNGALAAPWFNNYDVRADITPPGVVSGIAAGWYPGWVKAKFPPTSIPWSIYDEVTFAFAGTTPNTAELNLFQEEETLKTFSQEAKAHGVKALISIGGWTGSRFFSPAVATPENRTVFVKTIVDLVDQYELDGVDFDWEFPNSPNGGLPCNMNAPEDTANFLEFLKELRQDPKGSTITITAAAHIAPFHGADGLALKDVAEFATVFDHLAIMGYDIHGQFTSPAAVGANAPLNGGCPASPKGSVAEAVEAWTTAGFPANKLLLAVPAYGRSFEVEAQNLLTNDAISNFAAVFNTNGHPLGEGETLENTATPDVCGDIQQPAGIFTFSGLITAGYLGADGKVAAGSDIIYGFDDCTKTPFLYKKSEKRMISYDDSRSWAAKGEFINQKGLAGFAVWHVAGDSTDNILLRTLRGTFTTTTVPASTAPTGSASTSASAAVTPVDSTSASAAVTPVDSTVAALLKAW